MKMSKQRNPFVGVPEIIRRPLIWARAAVFISANCGYTGLGNYSLYAVQVRVNNGI